MQFQSVFESVCRCFGHSPASPNGPGPPSAASQPINDSGSASSVKRRTNRLHLDNEEWDELFDSGVPPEGAASVLKKDTGNQRQISTSSSEHLDNAHELAKAKLAANPSRYRPKRKRSVKSRDDIFRSKDAPPFKAGTCGDQPTPFSRLMNPSVALCFATPVRETQDEPDETTLKSCDASETGTLNTCEDTITSTVFFDNKYSHIQETRPPMPLFNQFKLGGEENEIHTIVATDSHSSVKLIQLLQQQQNSQRQETVRMDTSDSDHEPSQRLQQQSQPKETSQFGDVDMSSVPDVKAMSSSSGTSRSSSSQSQKQESLQF